LDVQAKAAADQAMPSEFDVFGRRLALWAVVASSISPINRRERRRNLGDWQPSYVDLIRLEKLLAAPDAFGTLTLDVLDGFLSNNFAITLTQPPKKSTLRRRRAAMTKITPDHLARSAFVYIRQSTTDQVLNNHESRRRQYGLAKRARQLGWQDVVVIDDDLGRSGSGVTRPGFERLLAAICEGRAGAVFAIEASRLARNGRDWHTLIEFCGLVGAIIIDEDGVYEPRHPNDRLLLGMKGTMGELELSILRQRSVEALKQKARRGELFMTVAVGYAKVRHDRIEKEPD
jgi:DNA invertase Pin-like site-specific DNA recombinase